MTIFCKLLGGRLNFLNSRVRLSILIVFFVVMTACTGDAVDDRLYLSPSAYGPVRVGMSIEEASEQLGMALVPGYELTEDDHFCHYVYAADQKDQITPRYRVMQYGKDR